MNVETIRTFFFWCTVLNGSILIMSALICVFAGELIYRFHRRWFPMSREQFSMAIYLWVGLYKIVFITFNLIPWLALEIIPSIG